MPVVQLNANFCLFAGCEPGKKKTDWYSDSVTGLVLECRSSGGKTFYYRCVSPEGRQRQIKIAVYGDLSFDKVRKRAQQLRSMTVLGEDPAAKKDVRKATPTYAELAAQHLEFAKSYQRKPSNTESVINNHLLPQWGKLRLDEITTQKVAKWLGDKANDGFAPATVEKMRTIFNRSFELAAKWNIPGGQNNPVRNAPRRKFTNSRERFLNAQEASRLLDAADQSQNAQLRPIIGLLLLTGARVSELLHAQWQHVDLERQTWLIPLSKNGKHRYVPLPQAAIDIMNNLPKFDRCPYLIPNPETRLPFVSFKRAWNTARTEAGLKALRIHDLRHSAATAMAAAGVDLLAIGKVLGHSDYKSTLRYAHAAQSTLLKAVEAGSATWATQ